MSAIQQVLVSIGEVTPPPAYADLMDWWDNRDADFAVTGALIDTWTGRVNGTVLTGTTTTRPTKVTSGNKNYVSFQLDYLAFSGVMSWDRQATSLFIVMRYGVAGTDYGVFNAGSLTSTDSILFTPQQLNQYNSGFRTTGIYPGDNLAVLGRVANGSTNVKMRLGGETYTVLTPNTAGTVTGGYIGALASAALPITNCEIVAILTYSKTLSDTEIEQVVDWAVTRYKATPRNNVSMIFFEGDSLSFGYAASSRLETYPAQLARHFLTVYKNPKLAVVATNGMSLNGLPTARLTTQIGFHPSMTNRVILFWLGTNDIGSSRSYAQVTADLDTAIAAYRAAYPTIPIVGGTIISRSLSGAQETVRGQFNDYVRNTADFDHVVDLAADTRLDDYTDTTYFNVDQVHLTDLGYGVVAELFYAVLAAQNLP